MDDDEQRKGKTEESGSPAITAPSEVQDVPDPEEDDLDDLDDMLGEFSVTKLDVSKEKPPKAEPRIEDVGKPTNSDAAARDFGRQLQDQMAALMGTVDESPEMKKEIEAMMQELGAAAKPELAGSKSDPAKAGAVDSEQSSAIEEPFQETIRKTMERMQASGKQATAAAKSEESDDMLAQMLKEMQGSGLENAGEDEGFNKMLMGMMEQLTNKDILYEPMKELHDKFPAWMAKNRANSSTGDLTRYEKQQRLVGEIVGKFEQQGYSDSKAIDREYIVERMQQMQAAGSPPADLVGDMNSAQDALGDVDSGCAQQ